MKARHFPYALAFLLMAATACQSRCPEREEIVCETYTHRYGVPLPPDEWEDRGQHGQVVSTRRDGVVVSKTYEAGILHGETTYSFPHRDVTQHKQMYEQGTLTQEWFYYPNGMPQQQIIYEAPGKQTLVVWYEGGAPQCKEEYENSYLVRGEYYNPSNLEESRVEDQNGLRTRRDAYGQLQSVDEIRNGKMVLRTTYHPNGAPATMTPYANNVIEGQRRTYYLGGEPATVEEWTNNCQHGNTVVFENGEKCADISYVKGRRQGMERRYRDNGQTLVQEVTWVQGKRHGPCYSYIGNTTQTDWFFQDRKVNKATFDALSNQ
ncbi:toxin-antitoxin system YwqK family antitoxin [Candidatus Protochlamydia phocaeensis]|uniref:toxin-antitoxin system YwqK family antitoxin n=1 Tax=Candidatus Protochlamydia phocaeensis TaxID=1414722 RepID=UPI0008386E8B|nr:toxin-antitoxin system YwqK family antitoxin [Candidatus Protochlamydia phocaeensis]